MSVSSRVLSEERWSETGISYKVEEGWKGRCSWVCFYTFRNKNQITVFKWKLKFSANLCPNPCDPMNYSTPGFSVLHYLVELAQTSPLSQWCNPVISSSVTHFSSCLQSFPTSGSFPLSQLFTSGGQRIGASALASVLPMNIQGWFPLGNTSLICL